MKHKDSKEVRRKMIEVWLLGLKIEKVNLVFVLLIL